MSETFEYVPEINATISFSHGASVSTDLQFRKEANGVSFIFDGSDKVYQSKSIVPPPKRNIHHVSKSCHVLYVIHGIGSSYNEFNYSKYIYKNVALGTSNDIYVVPVIWRLGNINDTCGVRESLSLDNPFRDYLGKMFADLVMITKNSTLIENVIFTELARVQAIVIRTLEEVNHKELSQSVWATSGSTITLLNGLISEQRKSIAFTNVFMTGALYPYLYRAECIFPESPAEHILAKVPLTRFHNIYFDYDPFSSVFSGDTPLDIKVDSKAENPRFEERIIRSSVLLKPFKHIAGMLKHMGYFTDKKLHSFISSKITSAHKS